MYHVCERIFIFDEDRTLNYVNVALLRHIWLLKVKIQTVTF